MATSGAQDDIQPTKPYQPGHFSFAFIFAHLPQSQMGGLSRSPSTSEYTCPGVRISMRPSDYSPPWLQLSNPVPNGSHRCLESLVNLESMA